MQSAYYFSTNSYKLNTLIITRMKLKFSTVILLAQMFAFSVCGQKPTCKSLHTGSFKVPTKDAGTTYIKRTAKEQYEKNDYLGYELILSVTWIDDCTYELRPKKLIKGDPAIMGDGTNVVRTKIKKISVNSYIAETTGSYGEGTVDFVVDIIDEKPPSE